MPTPDWTPESAADRKDRYDRMWLGILKHLEDEARLNATTVPCTCCNGSGRMGVVFGAEDDRGMR